MDILKVEVVVAEVSWTLKTVVVVVVVGVDETVYLAV